MNVIDDKPFNLPGYRTTLLTVDNQSGIQSLLEKCADYIQMVTGSPPKPSAASSLLTDCPGGKTSEDKVLIGIKWKEDGLVGVMDAIRDYPAQDDWWIGLLLLEPAHRNSGLGRRIYQAFELWASQKGARRIFLGVVDENQKAYQFWRSMGFQLVEKQPAQQFGNQSHVVLTMMRDITEVEHD